MQKKSPLKTDLPKTTHVNKTLLLIVFGVLTIIIFWVIINAFSNPSAVKKDKGANLNNIKHENVSAVNSAINNLPGSYQDVNAIKKYSGGTSNDSLASMQVAFAELKAEQEALEKHILDMTQKRSVPEPTPAAYNRDNDPQTQQAKTSALFFNGIGPGPGDALGGSNSRPMGDLPGSSSNASSAAAAATNQLQAAGLGGASTAQQAAFFNKQAGDTQRMAVMKAMDNPEDIYDLHNVVTPASPYEIQAGTVIPTVLITGINTTVTGTVVAQVRTNMYDTVGGKYLLIPRGSKMLGDYESRVSYGQRRVLITFNRIIRPDGSSVLLGKPTGSDLQGHAGLEGDVDNHWARVLGAATISTILSVGSGVASDHYARGSTYYPSAREGAVMGAASGISQTGQSITNRALDIQPTITLPAGYQFNVIVKKDMVLTPYHA